MPDVLRQRMDDGPKLRLGQEGWQYIKRLSWGLSHKAYSHGPRAGMGLIFSCGLQPFLVGYEGAAGCPAVHFLLARLLDLSQRAETTTAAMAITANESSGTIRLPGDAGSL